MKVDVNGFQSQMELQRQRSKKAQEQVDMNSQLAVDALAAQVSATQFLGYSQLEAEGRVVGLVADGKARDSAEEGEWQPNCWPGSDIHSIWCIVFCFMAQQMALHGLQ